MWAWDKRKAQTLSPRSANRLEYSTPFSWDHSQKSRTPIGGQTQKDYQPKERLSHSGIPWGYFTTRRPLRTPFTGSVNPVSNGSVNTNSPYGTLQGQSKNQREFTHNRHLSQFNQHQNKRKALTSVSRKSAAPVQPQSKQPPIQKRIDRSKREKLASTHADHLLGVVQTGKMSVNPLFKENSAPVEPGVQTGSFSNKVSPREKWSENKSNSSVHAEFVENSIYKSSGDGQLSDSDTSNISEVHSSPRDEDVNNFDQEIVQGQGVPLYATVFKNKQEKPAVVKATKSSPVSSRKKDEPVYSTIGERKADASGKEEQGNQKPPLSISLHEQIRAGVQLKKTSADTKPQKELPPRKMSVLDELKLRFSGKMGFLKSTKPIPLDKEEQTEQEEANGVKTELSGLQAPVDPFNPAEVTPPAPPQVGPGGSEVAPNSPGSPITNTPPPPRFAPPPVPSAVVSDQSQEAHKQSRGTSEEVPLSNTVVNENGGPSRTSTADAEADQMPHKTSDDSESSSDESSSYSSDSEISSSQPSSVQVADGRPRSILKNKYEKPLVNPERLMPLSDSENEDDNASSQKGETFNKNVVHEEYNSNSLDRRGVSFTTDTLDNEGTAKKYEKEGIQMLKIDKGMELPPNYTQPKPVPAIGEDIVEQTPETIPNEVKPADVSISIQDEINPESKDEKTKVDDKVTPEPAVDTVDANFGLVKPAVSVVSSPQVYTFKPSIPETIQTPKPNGITVVNGTLPRNISPPPLVSSSPSGPTKPKNSEMYFTLRRTGDNISVVNISQDESALDNMSHRMTMDQYSRDTLRSNISVGTLRTMISIGGVSDLNDMQTTAYPGGDVDTLEHSLPFNAGMFEYTKQQV